MEVVCKFQRGDCRFGKLFLEDFFGYGKKIE
jgi:hypothetical protein